VAAIFYPSEKSGKKPGDKDFLNKVYVPLRVTPGVESGGFGVVGRIP